MKPDDDIRHVLESFTVSGIFQRKVGHRLVIASDGLPIHKPEIWGMLASEAALRSYFAEKQGHDDVSVVVILNSRNLKKKNLVFYKMSGTYLDSKATLDELLANDKFLYRAKLIVNTNRGTEEYLTAY